MRTGLAAPLATAAMGAATGLDGLEVGQVLDWYRAMVAGVDTVSRGGDPPPAALQAVAAIRDDVHRTLDGLSATRCSPRRPRATPIPTGSPPTSRSCLFGGVDTAESMTAIAAHHLLTHPDALDQVRADPTLLPGAIQESLRLEPAATRVDRYATVDTELAGVRIRAGDLVVVSLSGREPGPQPCSPTPTGTTSAATTRPTTWPSPSGRTTASAYT